MVRIGKKNLLGRSIDSRMARRDEELRVPKMQDTETQALANRVTEQGDTEDPL